MADELMLRECGETPRGSHGGHQYMLDATVYVCPGGYVLDNVRAGIEDVQQRYGADHAEPHDYNGGGHAEPAPPQTPEQQVRDLQHILQRVRETVGTDMALVSCEQHEARIEVLEGALRGVLAMFEKEIEQYGLTGALSVNTVRRWRNALDGESS